MRSVLLVTDDSVLACGLAHILEQTADLQFAGTVGHISAAAESMAVLRPEIVLIDIGTTMSMPLVADLHKSCPETYICLWARHLPDELAYQAMTIGVRGILGRTLPVSDFLSGLQRVAAGQVWFEERLMAGFFCYRAVHLTRRESQLVTLLAQGMRNKEIAYTLSLSEGTIKVYLSRLFEKLGVKDRFEVALYGLRHLMADPAAPDPVISESKAVVLPSLPPRQLNVAEPARLS